MNYHALQRGKMIYVFELNILFNLAFYISQLHTLYLKVIALDPFHL